ncbi:hypothetical protein OIU74_010263 [Salix koriyanagi]|uniref:Uncharacterized protein n=1 Tax=Salix koriyanagi TaxID=2511006 RepID=A0A9Q0QMA2_9ROSI|nr:hypothetical protein OIU74_010263 [Salix koriyanagi]
MDWRMLSDTHFRVADVISDEGSWVLSTLFLSLCYLPLMIGGAVQQAVSLFSVVSGRVLGYSKCRNDEFISGKRYSFIMKCSVWEFFYLVRKHAFSSSMRTGLHSSKLVSWERPPMDFIKVNVDDSSLDSGQLGQCRVWGIFGDSLGQSRIGFVGSHIANHELRLRISSVLTCGL